MLMRFSVSLWFRSGLVCLVDPIDSVRDNKTVWYGVRRRLGVEKRLLFFSPLTAKLCSLYGENDSDSDGWDLVYGLHRYCFDQQLSVLSSACHSNTS